MSFAKIESKASKEEGKKSKKAEPAPKALLHRGEAKTEEIEGLGFAKAKKTFAKAKEDPLHLCHMSLLR